MGQYVGQEEEEKALEGAWNYEDHMKHWRSWGSWFSWGSPIGLSLGFAITLLAIGGFLMMLHSIGKI